MKTEANTTIAIKDCTIINTYTIQIRNGTLVHDEQTTALRAAGYVVVTAGPSSSGS